MFCGNCGNPSNGVNFCLNCGSPAAVQIPSNGYPAQRKSKSTAVVLAVFFSFWTFLYSYKVDKRKFWTLLAIQSATSITGLFLIVILTYLAYESSVSNNILWFLGDIFGSYTWSNRYYYGDAPPYFPIAYVVLVMVQLTSLVFWLVSLSITAKRPNSFFDQL